MLRKTVKSDFVEYLVHTLIPDLKRSGSEETSKDFETCVEIIKSQNCEIISLKIALENAVTMLRMKEAK